VLDSAISRYRKLNVRKKFFVWAGIALIVGLFILLLWILRSPQGTISQSPSTADSVQSPVHQAGGQNHITQITPREKAFSGNTGVSQGKPPFSHQPVPQQASRDTGYYWSAIESIMVETRITYELKDGAELPADKVPFVPSLDAKAYLQSPDGNVGLDFISPVGFMMQDDRHIVVIDHFSLQDSSDLYESPIESLQKFDSISIPFITAGYGSSLKKMIFFEVSLVVNGQNILHYQWIPSVEQYGQDILHYQWIPSVEQFGSIRVSLQRVKQWVDQLNLPKNR